MKFTAALLILSSLAFAAVGCGNSATDAVDKPLTKDAPPPPPAPNKAHPAPAAAGGGTTPTGSAAGANAPAAP